MRPNPPNCENMAPYCPRTGAPMKCVKENETEWVFQCPACEQVNVITKPEYKRSLREQVRRLNGIRAFK